LLEYYISVNCAAYLWRFSERDGDDVMLMQNDVHDGAAVSVTVQCPLSSLGSLHTGQCRLSAGPSADHSPCPPAMATRGRSLPPPEDPPSLSRIIRLAPGLVQILVASSDSAGVSGGVYTSCNGSIRVHVGLNVAGVRPALQF